MEKRLTLTKIYLGTLLIIAITEALIMLFLWHYQIKGWPGLLIDTFSLTLIIAPFVYLLNIKALRDLKVSEDKFKKVTDVTKDAIIVINEDSKVSCWNSAAERIFGYTGREAIGKDLHLLLNFLEDYEKLIIGDPEEGAIASMRRTLELTCRRKDGKEIPVEFSIYTISIGDKKHFVNIIRDITDRKNFENQIAYLAYHDSLTGLPNRTLLKKRLEEAIIHARGNNQHLALLFMDLNNFKYINDTLGHGFGDLLLKMVAERLKSCFRSTDTIAKIGGDEFIILVREILDTKDVIKIINKLFSTFMSPFLIDKQSLYVTASVGISIYPEDGTDAEVLLKYADIAMHRAQSEGVGNVYKFFSPIMGETSSKRLQIETDLNRALEREEFVLQFQPQLSLATGNIIGVEALLRWRDPDKGLVFPKDFITIAEESGLIVQIGKWVLNNACKVLKRWKDTDMPSLHMAVNLSLRQFREKDFVNSVKTIISNFEIDPGNLELELTESILMEDMEATITILEELKTLGVRLSIDDFGTGYSSFWYLKKMPINVLKIAQPFINDLKTSSDAKAIVIAIIRLAHTLRLEVIAEGVETGEQLKILKELGCDTIQGYIVARPMFLEDLEKFISEYTPARLLG